jgi:hypothetical protein
VAAGLKATIPMRSTMSAMPRMCAMPTMSAPPPATMCADARAVVGDRGFVAQLPGI